MKMFRVTPVLGLALSIAVSGGVANADSISASLFSPLAPSGTTPTAINLTGITAPSHSTIHGTGYTVTFSTAANQGVVRGDAAGLHAVPVAGVSGTTPEYLTGNYGSALTTNVAASGNYFSTGLGTVTFTFTTPQTSIAVLWGSIDAGNSLTFNETSHYKVTGTAVKAAAGAQGNGFQGAGGSAYVVVDTSTPFTTITATSTVPSFEFAALAASTAAFTTSPEPTTSLLIALGIGMIAFGAHRRGTRKTTI